MTAREPGGRAASRVTVRPFALRGPRPDAAHSRPAPTSPAPAAHSSAPAAPRPAACPPAPTRSPVHPSSGGLCRGGAARAADHRRIAGRQREILRGAASASVQSLLVSARTLPGKAARPGRPHRSSLLTPAGALHAHALEECGKTLLLGRLPEKGGIVPVPQKEIFRPCRKKFKAALGTLPPDCALMMRKLLDRGPPCLRQHGARPGADFAGRTHLLCLDMTRCGDPVVPELSDPEQLSGAVGGLERAAAELAAKGRAAGPGWAAPGGEGG